MTAVKIYKPAKTAMSSGRAKTKRWVLVFDRENCQYTEPVMQWTGATSTQSQIRLFFETKEEAVAFAKRHRWVYHLIEPHTRVIKPKDYTENFTRRVVR